MGDNESDLFQNNSALLHSVMHSISVNNMGLISPNDLTCKYPDHWSHAGMVKAIRCVIWKNAILVAPEQSVCCM